MGKRYLRMRVETYSEQNRDGEFGELVKKDSLLIIDNTIVGKTGGFLRIGMERQRLLKVNPKYRLRTGVDVLVGFQSQNKTGSYAVIDIKENIITSKDYSRKDFEGEKYFTTGLAAFAGLDYRITSQVYLGLNVDYNFLYAPKKSPNVELGMRISPYLAWKF
jgi:opacity protein-like surface antigen